MRGLLFMYQDLLQEVTMGLFAPNPNQGPEAPGPVLADIA